MTDKPRPEPGDRVRIVGGDWDGAEGVYQGFSRGEGRHKVYVGLAKVYADRVEALDTERA